MKKALFFLIFLVIGGFAAKAQYVPVDGLLSYKWGGIYDANGHRLSRDEGNANYFLTPQQQRMFKRGRNQYLWGAGITLSAVASVSYYALMDAGYVENTDEMNVFIGLATVMAWYSLPCLIAGPSLLLTGRHKMKDLTEDYNYARQNKGDVSLSFGPQQHGYGMAITFLSGNDMLVYSPGGMLEVPPDTPHSGTLLIGIAKPIPVIRDMDLIRRLFS